MSASEIPTPKVGDVVWLYTEPDWKKPKQKRILRALVMLVLPEFISVVAVVSDRQVTFRERVGHVSDSLGYFDPDWWLELDGLDKLSRKAVERLKDAGAWPEGVE